MRGLKKVSALLLASAMVATAGIGAVSFAQWQAATSTEKSVDSALGVVDYVGFDGASDALTVNDSTKKLVPLDQNLAEGDTTHTKMLEVSLPAYTVSADYTVTVKLEAKNSAKFDTDTVFWAYFGETAPSSESSKNQVPTSAHGSTDVANGWEVGETGNKITWQKINVTNGYGFAVTGVTGKTNVAANARKVWIVLESSKVEDMGIEFTVTVTLAKTPTT